MMSRCRLILILGLLGAISTGCAGGRDDGDPGTTPDASSVVDATAPDASVDAGRDPVDADVGEPDTGPPPCMPSGTTETTCDDLIDDDCDGAVDCDDADCGGAAACMELACSLAGSEVRITDTAAGTSPPELLWTGSELGLVWRELVSTTHGDVYFDERAADGSDTGGAARALTTSGSVAHPPRAVWTGTHYGVVYSDTRTLANQVYFQILDATGTPVGMETQLTHSELAFLSDVTYNDATAEFGLAWMDQTGAPAGELNPRFRRVGIDGTMAGTETEVSTGPGFADYVRIGFDGTNYGVVWHEDRGEGSRVFFARVDATGASLGADFDVSRGGPANIATIVSNGNGYAVLWDDYRGTDSEAYFARLDLDGTPLGAPRQITSSPAAAHGPRAAWDGDGYLVVWSDTRGASDANVYGVFLDPEGAREAPPFRISCGTAGRAPTVVWTGTGYAVAWIDDRDGNYEIYLRTFTRDGVDDLI